MITQEQNERMTRIGPGTPAGELLRRYWQPFAPSGELTAENPIKRVKILCEDLVAYRDTKGGYGLVAEHCPHRKASLAWGHVDDQGIRCPYHGWKFNGQGRCLEQPAEPAGSRLKEEVRHTAYPVRKLGGMLFAYMGPLPAPILPRWDVLAWEKGRRWIDVHEVLECNWLQAMENSVDPVHLYWLHLLNRDGTSPGYSFTHFEEKDHFFEFPYGIMKRRTLPGKNPGDKERIEQHPLLFPNTLRHVGRPSERDDGLLVHDVQIRVPIDDTHTQIYRVNFAPTVKDISPADADAPFKVISMKDEKGNYRMDFVRGQDTMAWETQGRIADRPQEMLGTSDMGIVKYRKLLLDQIKIVEEGGAPMARVPAAHKDRVIEFEVINDRFGLHVPTTEAVLDKVAG